MFSPTLTVTGDMEWEPCEIRCHVNIIIDCGTDCLYATVQLKRQEKYSAKV